MPDDAQLLRRYVEERSQEAFAELVRRHVNVVYFAALRRVGGDAHCADDVTQGVFTDLARKAPSLLGRTVLTGWLYTSTRFAAAQAVRSQQRRRTHELEAHAMNELHATPGPDWNRLRPVIDEALDDLDEPEREALLLRFFEDRPFAEVGARFSLSADAARMRVERALEKLRGLLAKRGIASTAAALAAAFAAQSGLAAPAGLAARVVAGAFGQAGATTTTLAFWKILASAGVGALGIGLFVYHQTLPDPAAASPVGRAAPQDQSMASAVPPARATAPQDAVPVARRAENTAVASVAQAESPSTDHEFAGLSEKQQDILKTLWEHFQQAPPGVAHQRWGFRPGSETAEPVLAEFEEAAELLRADGLVGIGPKFGMVYLTNKGSAFCQAHAQELDDHPLKPHVSRPLFPPNPNPSLNPKP